MKSIMSFVGIFAASKNENSLVWRWWLKFLLHLNASFATNPFLDLRVACPSQDLQGSEWASKSWSLHHWWTTSSSFKKILKKFQGLEKSAKFIQERSTFLFLKFPGLRRPDLLSPILPDLSPDSAPSSPLTSSTPDHIFLVHVAGHE